MRSTVRFETFGPLDDVIVTMSYSQPAVRVIRELPSWARAFDATSRTWRIHPSFARNLAAGLRRIGYEVVGVDLGRAPHEAGHCAQSTR